VVLYGLLRSGHAAAEWAGLFSLGVLILFPGLRHGRVPAWLLLGVIAAIAGYATASGHRALVNSLPQILISLFLLTVFGRTLRPGSIPIITRISTAMRKGQSEVPARYTRGVTILWVVMFALLALEGLLLAWLEPAISLGQISMVTYAVIIIVVVGEYCFHSWRFPNPEQRGLADFVRQLIQIDYRRLLSD
jgi:uncharacterized membrane protein